MKSMKAYKIPVPESTIIPTGYFGNEPVGKQQITRQEIHELIKAHAEKLGYKIEHLAYDYDDEFIIIDGSIYIK